MAFKIRDIKTMRSDVNCHVQICPASFIHGPSISGKCIALMLEEGENDVTTFLNAQQTEKLIYYLKELRKDILNH